MITIQATGHAAADAELKFTSSGKPVLNARIGVTNRRKDGDSWIDDGAPMFVGISIWGPMAELLAEKDAIRKGSKVTLSGKLTRRTYQRQDGTEGETLEVRSVDAISVEPPREQSQPYSPPADAWGASDGAPF